MQIFNQVYAAENAKLNKEPIYVLEIIWNDGAEGVGGVNDFYFSTHSIDAIVNFPYPERFYPLLAKGGISSISQKVDPINGVSSIGSMTFKLVDYQKRVSNIIQAADAAGHGFKRQRCNLFVFYKGMNWANRIKIRTLQVSNLGLANNGMAYQIKAYDVQRNLKNTVFQPVQTRLSAAMLAGDMSATVLDSTQFLSVPNHVYGTVGFVKMDDEIMMWSANTSNAANVLTIAANGRGMFGTTAADHAIDVDVKEIIVLRENPFTMALKVMTSTGLGTNGAYDVLPKHWGVGMDAVEDVDIPEWLTVGQQLVGLGTPAASDGLQYQFLIDKSMDCKKFIEAELLKTVGAFGMVHGNGAYGVRAYSDLANVDKLNAVRHLALDEVISWGELSYQYDKIANSMLLEFDESPALSGKFIRSSLFFDADSQAKWGAVPQLKYKVKGVIPTGIFVDQLYQRFHLVASKFSRPPLAIDVVAMPKNHDLEIGDIVRLSIPMHDLLAQADLDRAFEVESVGLDTKTGEVKLHLQSQPEVASVWYPGNGQGAKYISDAVYMIGNFLSWDGSTNLTLQAGDYWVSGNLTIAFGVTLTINGSVRLFSTGIVTIEGTIDGKGKGGLLGGLSGAWYVSFNPSPEQGMATGYIGRGGRGSGGENGLGPQGATGGAVQNPPPIAPVIIGTNINPITGQWDTISGLPQLPLAGSGGGGATGHGYAGPSYGSMGYGTLYPRTRGGDGGAGLLIMARGIFCTVGQIDLRGAQGDAGKSYPELGLGGGGGGGGGSFIGLAERDVNGLPVLNIDKARVLTSGGAGGGANPPGGLVVRGPGYPGGSGTYIAQLIG